jgi:ATP-dependent Clp protease protease subunit
MLENKLVVDQEEEEQEEKKEESSISDKMLKTRTILISEAVTSKSASKFINNLLLLEQDDPEKEITILINSPGGEIYSGLAMYDMMAFISCPIKTVVVGLAASMGSILLLAGDKDKRYALPNSKVLIHQPLLSGVYQGRATELEIQANEMLKLRTHLNGIIADKTGQSLDKVEKDTERDNWLDAKESLEYNLVSKIITSKKDMA